MISFVIDLLLMFLKIIHLYTEAVFMHAVSSVVLDSLRPHGL